MLILSKFMPNISSPLYTSILVLLIFFINYSVLMIGTNFGVSFLYHNLVFASTTGSVTANNNSGASDSSFLANSPLAASFISNNASQRDTDLGILTAAANFTEPAGPPLGALQIPYTGLSRYHIAPEDAKLFGLNDSSYAMIITEVEHRSPAAIAGIRGGNMTTNVAGDTVKLGGDVVLRIDGNDTYVRTNEAFLNYLQNEKRAGENITFTVIRDGQISNVNLTVAPLPRFLWYDDEDEGIRIKYPSDWEVSGSETIREIVKFSTPTGVRVGNDTEPSARISVLIFPAGDSGIDDVAELEQRDTAEKRNLDVRLTGVSNFPGYEATFYDYSGDRTLKKFSVFTIKDERLYRIDFATDPSRYDDYLPLAREVIRSFQFTK